MIKNGIILAGGQGTRLAPLTQVINKHLLGVDGKFIIDYPLNTLKQMGIENCTVVLGGNHFSQVVDHLKNGQTHDMNFNYIYQGEAKGISQAINICQRFVNDDKFVVILGDNIFSDPIEWNAYSENKAQIALYKHPELKRFGVASLDNGIIKEIEEKPQQLSDRYHQEAITGCYLFDQRFFDYFKTTKPSARGEFEITEIINAYLKDDALTSVRVNGYWSDAGTHESIKATNQYFYSKKF